LADAVSFTLMSRELWKGSTVYGIHFIFIKENHSLAKEGDSLTDQIIVYTLPL